MVDAGCGTGGQARALAARGYRVIGIDRSPELIAEARRGTADPARLEFEVADLRTWAPPRPAAAALCRGVLNDPIEEAERRDALVALAAMLAPGGVLLADVRDRDRSAARYAEGRRVERRAETGGGPVELRSETRFAGGELVVDERLTFAGIERRHEVRMRPWTPDELEDGLRRAGFARVDLIDPREAGAREDRVVVLATLSGDRA